jgi:hypothetical protein
MDFYRASLQRDHNFLYLGEGLEMGASRMPGAGVGLFTTTPLMAGSRITFYDGWRAVITLEPCDSRSHAIAVGHTSGNSLVILGFTGLCDVPPGAGVMSLCNAAPPFRANCRRGPSLETSNLRTYLVLGQEPVTRLPVLESMRHIAVGEELTWNYRPLRADGAPFTISRAVDLSEEAYSSFTIPRVIDLSEEASTSSTCSDVIDLTAD